MIRETCEKIRRKRILLLLFYGLNREYLTAGHRRRRSRTVLLSDEAERNERVQREDQAIAVLLLWLSIGFDVRLVLGVCQGVNRTRKIGRERLWQGIAV